MVLSDGIVHFLKIENSFNKSTKSKLSCGFILKMYDTVELCYKEVGYNKLSYNKVFFAGPSSLYFFVP